MRSILRDQGWDLIAGEFPGGSDHELYPLNVIDPTLARDGSPDPRRHSLGELIPDLVALRCDQLILAEAKIRYSERDREKLANLVGFRRADLMRALVKFAVERNVPALLPVERLRLYPTLVFLGGSAAPEVPNGFSYLRVHDVSHGAFEGQLGELDEQ